MGSKFAIGLAIVAVLIAVVFFKQRGDHLEPTGSILKVRSIASDEQHSIVVLELRIQNDSDVAMRVRDLSMKVEMKDGHEMPGVLISKPDTKQLFTYYPALGEIYNQSLVRDTKIGAHETADFMLAGRIDLPESQLAERRTISVAVQDRTMSNVTLVEKGR